MSVLMILPALLRCQVVDPFDKLSGFWYGETHAVSRVKACVSSDQP